MNIYHTYSEEMKKRFGEKVYKLPVNLPVSCPNRENGKGGCIFCSDLGTGFECMDQTHSVTEQLWDARNKIEKKYNSHRFIAYFQNYTNTYLPVEAFRNYMEEAAKFQDLVAISVSTRPDCISKEYLDVLKDIERKTDIAIFIELGLQTINYRTLDFIQRGHGIGAFLESVLLINKYHFDITVHLILNLPGDTIRDVEEVVEVINALPIQGVKLHSLYVPRNTKLSSLVKNGKIKLGTREEYFERVSYFITHCRPDIMIERLFSRIPEEESDFSNWGCSWRKLHNDWESEMRKNQLYQGIYYSCSCDRSLIKINDLDEEKVMNN